MFNIRSSLVPAAASLTVIITISTSKPASSPSFAFAESSNPPIPVSKPNVITRFYRYSFNLPPPDPPPILNVPPIFTYPTLTFGNKVRTKNGVKLNHLTHIALEATKSNDREKMAIIANEVSRLAFGKSITPQMRQTYIEQYGCCRWSDEAMQLIHDLSHQRGVVEVGAGNGQWVRHLKDKFRTDILAFDDYSSIPLSLSLYHVNTKPSNAFFYPDVKRGGGAEIFNHPKLQNYLKGRVLLMVFPGPDSMAKDTLRSYMEVGPMNDTLVYVGEGREGVNGDSEFFDMLENGDWILIKQIDVVPFGDYGFEKMWVMKRRQQ
ncbi:hypothetical protein ScalyP_jg10080 [Parmales sp. scaly parma]|nr:hypothetical protein ScalyP_jg10080 [Parmales sp. scaly parma]